MTSTRSGAGGEHRVEGGLWWNGGTWTIRSVPEEGGTLPETGPPWRRVPGWLLLPLAPVVGGAFVVALPLVGAFMVVEALAKVAVGRGSQAAQGLAATVAAPALRPGEAHLTGQAPVPEAHAEPPPGEAAPNGPLDEVEAEVKARRQG
jgi:hypothetical protein